MIEIRTLGASGYDGHVPWLADLLIDAVAGGAGVSFLRPLDGAEAQAYWLGIKPAIASGRTLQFAAQSGGTMAGTVLLQKAWAPNQPHRCEVAKLLVHRDHRRHGIGTLLMNALVEKARASGFTLITFDAVAHGAAEAFYRGLGFTCAGYIPGYAYSISSEPDDTAIFYMKL